MTPLGAERWRALSPYLDEALEIPTIDRDAWLAQIFERDAGLAIDLRTMLAEHDVYITDWHNARDVPLSDGQTLAWIYAHGEVLGRRDDGEAAHLSVRLSDADLGRLRHRQRLH